MRALRGLYRGLEALNGADSGVDPVAFLVPFTGSGPREELVVVRESEDGVEIALALAEHALERLERRPHASVLGDAALADTLPVVEGLSHLLYLVEAVRRERPVSGLELETQAEVDKLALCLLARWPAARDDFPRLVDRLLCQWSPLPGQSESLRERYAIANRVALRFIRGLERCVRAGQLGGLRRRLRRFWSADMPGKLALAGA
ncbi:hypothetical protein [Nannocystis sp.]|uniref:hypothetical protein n=1 Tax=Nannocystis sp. TaxID=1962667 RepID=UPI0025DB597D|nr:hypothetical protein [Nannocystis sp.]MBK7825510.1 hypothetical protein [Nannocystis sp.]